MTPVERQKRDQVEHEQCDVQRREQADHRVHLVDDRDVVESGELAGRAADADDTDRAVGVARARAERGVPDTDEALGQVDDHAADRTDLGTDRGKDRGGRLLHEFAQRPDADESGLGGHGYAARVLHHRTLCIRHVLLRGRRCDCEGVLRTVALHDDRERLVSRLLDDRGRLVPAGDRRAADAHDAVAGADACGVRRSGRVGRSALLVRRGRRDETGADRGDGGAVLRSAEAAQQDREQRDADQEVHHRAAEHDDDALGDREAVEGTAVLAGGDGLRTLFARILHHVLHEAGGRVASALAVLSRREHADHRDVAAERDRLNAVLGLAFAEREERLAEPDHVLGDFDAEQLRGHEVPDFVQTDRHCEADHHDGDAEDEEQHGFHAATLPPGTLEPAGHSLCLTQARPGCRARSQLNVRR